jgi:hypothetical protein
VQTPIPIDEDVDAVANLSLTLLMLTNLLLIGSTENSNKKVPKFCIMTSKK